jgi:hypothetical protein
MHNVLKKSNVNIKDMIKFTDNFYCIIQRNKKWSPEQIKILKKNVNYTLFSPISIGFINETIYGYSNKTKFIMFNFDTLNGKKHALRGIACVTTNHKGKKGEKFYTLDLICNSSVKNSTIKCVKKRRGIITKNGRDMIEYWKRFGKSKFSYFKLKSMETVLGFYWKLGWRFNLNGKFKTIWDERICELNKINKSIDSTNICAKDRLRHVVLTKYFDRFLEGYYSDSSLSRNNVWYQEHSDHMLNNTIDRGRWDLRYNGYTMYWNTKDR